MVTSEESQKEGRETGSGWRPLRAPAFRNLWGAQFVSNIGEWMQTVAAQWVMLGLTRSAFLIAAISAASSLPVFVLAVPFGALGDLVDRKRLILGTQILMLGAAAAMAALALADGLTSWILLGLLFVVGCGTAASGPVWQTLQPELAPADERTAAIALGAVNQNLARAVGPAIGGALLAATSAAVVFGVNAFSFVVVVITVAVTAIPIRKNSLPLEHEGDAIRAGARYVANTPVLVSLIVRCFGFVFPAGALWALLPLVANQRLGLGASGYGLLLACVGVGAMLAATYGPALRRALSPRAEYAVAAILIAAGAVALSASRSVVFDALVLVVAGAAWISGLGLLGAAYQTSMPTWVKSRGMAYYIIGLQGSVATGALAFGTIAQATSVSTALVVMAAMLVLVTVAGLWPLALPQADMTTVVPVTLPPAPSLDAGEADAGPVMVEVAWTPTEDHVERFLADAHSLRRVRRRTGAVSWKLYRDAADPSTLVESFTVGSWEDHERQHERLDAADVAVLDSLMGLSSDPTGRRPHRHLLAVATPRR